MAYWSKLRRLYEKKKKLRRLYEEKLKKPGIGRYPMGPTNIDVVNIAVNIGSQPLCWTQIVDIG